VKALEKIHFRPMYAKANMGHPSREEGRGFTHQIQRRQQRVLGQFEQRGEDWRKRKATVT
jgi:hypothetical protein